MSTDRTVALWEDGVNLKKLSDNGFSYCIAKSVINSKGQLEYNMVWQSVALAPKIDIKWSVQYGLNWCAKIPSGNAQVTMGGEWQECNPGDSYDLNTYGLWEESNGGPAPKAGFLNIGTNNYKIPKQNGIHVIVGVRDPDVGWRPIYADSLELGLGMSSSYQPQEKAQWWYERGTRDSTMITSAVTNVCQYDLTKMNPNTASYYVSTTFDYDSGKWTTSPKPPPTVMAAGVFGAAGIDTTTDDSSDEFYDAPTDVQKLALLIARALQDNKAIGPTKDDRLTGPGQEIFIGLMKVMERGMYVAAAHSVVMKLIDKGYDARVKGKVNDQEGEIEIKAPKKSLKFSLGEGDNVPDQVKLDWQDACAGAKHEVIDEGLRAI